MRRPVSKKDGNHDDIVRAFEQLGCSVAQLHHSGIAGWPDLVCGVIGVNHLVEVKNPETRYGREGLNQNQQAFARDWRGGKLYAVSTVDECAHLVRNWRQPK